MISTKENSNGTYSMEADFSHAIKHMAAAKTKQDRFDVARATCNIVTEQEALEIRKQAARDAVEQAADKDKAEVFYALSEPDRLAVLTNNNNSITTLLKKLGMKGLELV